MDKHFDRRKFLKVSGMSLGVGALISVAPFCGSGHGNMKMVIDVE